MRENRPGGVFVGGEGTIEVEYIRRGAKKQVAKKGKTSRARKRRGESDTGGLHLTGILKSFAAVCAVGAIVLGIVYWDRFIKQSASASEDTVALEIRAVPEWVNEALKEKLSAVARADGQGLQLDDTAARRVQQNIQELNHIFDDPQELY